MKNILLLLFILLFSLSCGGPKPYIPPYEYRENQLAKLLYDRAITYQNQGNLDLAIIEFRHFIDCYPEIYFVDEAQFNIAKCYEALSQFNEAINNYQILLKKYKQSDHRLEAIYRMAECYQKIDQLKEATNAYLLLIKKYSHTEWAKKAKERIGQMANKFPQSKWLRKINRTAEKIYRKSQKK